MRRKHLFNSLILSFVLLFVASQIFLKTHFLSHQNSSYQNLSSATQQGLEQQDKNSLQIHDLNPVLSTLTSPQELFLTAGKAKFFGNAQSSGKNLDEIKPIKNESQNEARNLFSLSLLESQNTEFRSQDQFCLICFLAATQGNFIFLNFDFHALILAILLVFCLASINLTHPHLFSKAPRAPPFFS